MGWTDVGLLIFLDALSVLAISLRIYSRRLNKAMLDASDYVCFLGMVS